jgi:hypothetical protein
MLTTAGTLSRRERFDSSVERHGLSNDVPLGVLLAGVGRLVSISKVGLPKPTGVWLGYLIPELVLPVVIAVAHRASL